MVLAGSGRNDAPECPKFSTVPRGFQEQPWMGHYNYWRFEELSYDVDEMQVSKAINRLYHWDESNCPYSEPKAPATRGMSCGPGKAKLQG